MVVVSLRDPHAIDADPSMLALHAPEGLGLRLTEAELEPAAIG
jgi:hypothetical protein